VGVLPLGVRGIRALDIGTGPAPALYAIEDFYRALSEFADLSMIPSLKMPSPELNCVERSEAMVHFFHRFSKFSGRAAPLNATFTEFQSLNLSGVRAFHRSQSEIQTQWDEGTQDFEEVYNPWAAEESDALFRYRLVILSNFLTLEAGVEKLQEELRGLFHDLKPGAVAIVLGARGHPYPQIYRRVAAIAREAGLTDAGRWQTDTLGHIDADHQIARRIKESQYQVYLHLERLVKAQVLQQSEHWADYGNPGTTRRAQPNFGLRLFRRGRWPEL
jgi:hypothetical protein